MFGNIDRCGCIDTIFESAERSEEIHSEKTYSKYKDCGENSVFYVSIFVKTYSTGRTCRSEEYRKYKEILQNRNLGNLDDLLCKDYINQIIDISTVGSVKAYLFDIATKYIAIVMGIGFLTVMIA